MELLEEPRENGLEDVELDRVQTVSHSGLQATGTAEYMGEEYELRASYTGERLAIRVSREDEVYTDNLYPTVLDRDDFQDRFEDIVAEADLDLAYTSDTSRPIT
jgi:hypothetical protein